MPMSLNRITAIFSILITYSLFSLLTGCKGKECSNETFPVLGDVMIRAYGNPESFDNYVQNNPDIFDKKFTSCLQEWIAELEKIEKKEREHCDDVYVSGDFWNQCIDEVNANYNNAILLASEVLNVIQGSSFSQSTYGSYLIYTSQTDPPLHQFSVALVEAFYREYPTECRVCKEKGFF